MDAKEAELARLGDELEKLEATDIAGRKEMEIKSLEIAEEVEVRKQLEIRETRSAEIMFDQKEMEQDFCRSCFSNFQLLSYFHLLRNL
jgi:hypothetical protein